MVYAQILNGIIVNIIELDDSSLVSLFAQGYDSCLEIDQLSTIPSIGWFYDTISGNFFPPATLALIQNNVIVNVIQNCDAYITNQAANYQYIIDVTGANPMPMVGWAFNGTTFIPTQAYYQALVSEAMAFGNQLMIQYAAQNVSEGITQAGMTENVMNYMTNLTLSLTTGSLYVAISQIESMIADTSSAKVGAYATGPDSSLLSGTITFTANTLGTIGNSISLTFTGFNTVGTVVSAWNAANPNNQVSYTGSSSAVPEAKTVGLSGGLPTLSPFVTNDILYNYLNQIQTWLGITLTPNPGP